MKVILILCFACELGMVAYAQGPPPVSVNDPYFGQQWGHHNLGNSVPRYSDGILVGVADVDADLPEAWTVTQGSSQVVIAIIDTGIRLDHPDLVGRIWQNEAEYPPNGQDDDGNGYIDDYQGWDFTDGDNDPSYTGGGLADHGTRMAGIAAANPNNGIGVAGVDWHCQVMILKTADNDGGFDLLQTTLDAIYYAADNGADFISLSYGFRLGYPLNNPFTASDLADLNTAVQYALSKGVLLFCEPGNDDAQVVDYPAGLANAVAVGVHSPCDERKSGSPLSCDQDSRISFTPEGNQVPWGSNYGSHIDLVAPGVLLPALRNTGVWEQAYGGSMAPPFTAGIAALMRAANPDLSAAQIRALLEQTAIDLETPGKDLETGFGRVNAFGAVMSAEHYCNQTQTVVQNRRLYSDVNFMAEDEVRLAGAVTLAAGHSLDALAGDEVVFTGDFTMEAGTELTARVGTVSCLTPQARGVAISTKSALSAAGSLPLVLDAQWAPNPFSQQTNFRFMLGEDQTVTIHLHTPTGKRFLLLEKVPLSAGTHQVPFDAQGLPAGWYYYEVVAGGQRLTGKLWKSE